MCGRGEGKTRSAAELVREEVKAGRARRIILAAPTAGVGRDVMVEGESGLLAVHPNGERPRYFPSKRRLVWPNGAKATIVSSDEPDLARGLQGDFMWGEEIGAWRYPTLFFDTLNPGLRLGEHPRGILTSTPRPIELIKRLEKDSKRPLLGADGGPIRGTQLVDANGQPLTGAKSRVILSRGALYDNIDNLADSFIEEMRTRYKGTRLERQELLGELLLDTPGALWTWALIEAARKPESELPPRELWKRVVIAVDPAVTSTEDSNETGIMIGILVDGPGGIDHAWVIRDASGRWHASEWPKIVARAYHVLQADRVVAEVNNGGDLVERALRVVDSSISYRDVTASRGKITRAEPALALYEQGRVHHCGELRILEEQMTTFVPGVSDKANAKTGSTSPDRVDALVWLLYELIIERQEMTVA